MNSSKNCGVFGENRGILKSITMKSDDFGGVSMELAMLNLAD